jgi:hypothetical protein
MMKPKEDFRGPRVGIVAYEQEGAGAGPCQDGQAAHEDVNLAELVEFLCIILFAFGPFLGGLLPHCSAYRGGARCMQLSPSKIACLTRWPAFLKPIFNFVLAPHPSPLEGPGGGS